MADQKNPTPSEIQAGAYFQFAGYDEASGDTPILKEGEIIQVSSYSTENGIIARSLLTNAEDNVFETEVVFADQADIDAALASVAGTAGEEAPAETQEATTEETTEEAPADAKADKPAKAAKADKAAKANKAKSTHKTNQQKREEVKDAVAENPVTDTAVAPGSAESMRALTIGTNSRSVQDILQMGGDEILGAAEDLYEQAETAYFTLGGVLAHVYSENLHKRLGFDGKRSFARYVEERLGMDYRKAMYWIDIYTGFSKLGISEDRLAGIGWSKAKEIIKVADKARAEELIEFAQEHTRAELIEQVKTDNVEAGDGSGTTRMKMTTFKFVVSEAAGVNINAALTSAANQCGSDKLGDQFEFIVGEWRTMQEGIDVPVEEAIALLEAKYGVSLQTVDPDTVVEADTATAETVSN